MITFAGLTLSHPTDEMIARWDRWRDRSAEEPAAPRGFLAPGTDHLPAPAWPDHLYRRPRLNVLVWPTGASRWAQFQCLATARQLAAVQAAVGDAGAAAELVIGTTANGGRRVATAMHLLTPRVIFDGYGLTKPLYLLTLVDERWHWWQESSGTAPSVTSWSSLLTGLLSAVGDVTPTIDAVHADYSTPRAGRWAQLKHRPLPVLIDAAAESVGCRVIRQTTGEVIVATATSCRTREDTNWTSYRARLEVGGRADVAAFGPSLPEAVRVVFDGTGPASTDVSLSSTGVFTGTSVAGVTGRTGVLHAEIPSSAASATRSAYAAVAAADWYRLCLSRVDAVFGGVCRWEPTGLEDRAEYEWVPPCADAPDGRVLTRVVARAQWDRGRAGGTPEVPVRYGQLSGATGAYGYPLFQQTLDSTGAWVTTGAPSWSNAARPVKVYDSGAGPVEFTPRPTTTSPFTPAGPVLFFEEPGGAGQFGFLPIQTAAGSPAGSGYVGYVSVGAQTFTGPKTFYGTVIVSALSADLTPATLFGAGDLNVGYETPIPGGSKASVVRVGASGRLSPYSAASGLCWFDVYGGVYADAVGGDEVGATVAINSVGFYTSGSTPSGGIGTSGRSTTVWTDSSATNRANLTLLSAGATGGGGAAKFTFGTTVGAGLELWVSGSFTASSLFTDAGGSVTADVNVKATSGDVEAVAVGKGFILKSPDGTRWRIAVSNAGVLSAATA